MASLNDRSIWHTFPSPTYTRIRATQIFLASLAILLIIIANALPGKVWDQSTITYIVYLPMYLFNLIHLIPVLAAHLNNPTRLSRVLPPKSHVIGKRRPTSINANPIKSRHGVTMTVIILEFAGAGYALAVFILGGFLISFCGYESDNSPNYWQIAKAGDDTYNRRRIRLENGYFTCKLYMGLNLPICAVMFVLFAKMMVWSVRVYRTGVRKTIEEDLETERAMAQELGVVETGKIDPPRYSEATTIGEDYEEEGRVVRG